MAETANLKTEKTWTSTAARFGWIVLILTTLYVCYFSHLGAIGFVGPDEPRYAWIARDMMETGDWVTPRLYGKPWFEKPPLFYWGAALCFKLFGVSEAAARLPSAISALLATLALAWLALRLYGAETARWLLLLLPTTVGMIGFSHAAATDMPFSGMLTIATVAAAVALRLVPRPGYLSLDLASSSSSVSLTAAQTPWLALILFGFFLGLAVLAKGPVGIVLCGGAIFFWALFTKRWRDAFRLFHPAAVIAFCVTALPWYILCARHNPDFLRVFIIEHNFKRYLTPEFQHIQPFWFYIPIFLLAFLPWTLMSFVPIASLVRQRKLDSWLNSGDTFFASWACFTVVFFSFSRSKLPGYILPVVPSIAFAYSDILRNALTSSIRYARTVAILISVTTLAMIAVTVVYSWRYRSAALLWNASSDYRWEIARIALGVAIYLSVLIAPFLAVIVPSRISVVYTVSSFLAFLLLAGFTLAPRLDLFISPRRVSRTIAAEVKPDEEVLLCGVPRSYSYGFAFYFHRELPMWDQKYTKRPSIVILGPSCVQEVKNPNYHLRLSSLPWLVIDVGSRVSGSAER